MEASGVLVKTLRISSSRRDTQDEDDWAFRHADLAYAWLTRAACASSRSAGRSSSPVPPEGTAGPSNS